MKIGIISYYYYPDLSAGSFRMQALVSSLLDKKKKVLVVCSFPNRYKSFQKKVNKKEVIDSLTIIRVPLILKKYDNIFAKFLNYLYFTISSFFIIRKANIDLIVGSSSRLMTAMLTFTIASILNKKFYLDIRDTFLANIEEMYLKNYISIFYKPLIFTLKKIENTMISRSLGTNLVSEGFDEYFEKNVKTFTYYTNGIDDLFLNIPDSDENNINYEGKVNILYAGNIGLGQGLENIIPFVAKNNKRYFFSIIGDGSKKSLLIKKIKRMGLSNIKVINPVNRKKLIIAYQEADILFLHLNDFKCLTNALPSKIFEYSVMGKPIVAGVNGFAKKFINNNFPHCKTFLPNNINKCEIAIEESIKLKVSKENVHNIKEKFSRRKIMNSMSDTLIRLYDESN